MKTKTPEINWNVSPSEAIAIQNRLREQVKTTSAFGALHTVAGVDVGVKGDIARAAIVVLDYPALTPRDAGVAEVQVTFPYVPGLLAFREMPAVLAALERLTTEPDLFIVDGHGQAHPRRMGIACHLGVVLDKPSIGCAKSKLVGQYQEPPQAAGAWTELHDQGEVIGAVVRTRPGTTPIFVSIGHRIDLATAIAVVLECTRGYRLPETTRWAHRVAGGASFTPARSSQSCSEGYASETRHTTRCRSDP